MKRLILLAIIVSMSVSGCAYHAMNTMRLKAKKLIAQVGLYRFEGEDADVSILRTSTVLPDKSTRQLKNNPDVKMKHGEDTYEITGNYTQ